MIEQTTRGWKSSLTGHTYDAESVAQHYENIERRRIQAQQYANDPTTKLMESLSAEQIRGIAERLHLEVTDNNSRTANAKNIDAFFKEHPELMAGSQQGANNAVTMNALLRNAGKSAPYSEHELLWAIQAGVNNGSITLDPAFVKAQEPDPYDRLNSEDYNARNGVSDYGIAARTMSKVSPRR